MKNHVEVFEEFERNDEYTLEEKTDKHMLTIIRGTIKKELIGRLENQSEMFPFSNRRTLHYVNYYIIKKCFLDAPQAVKDSILSNARSIHRKEIRRIQKALRTIESNVMNELPKDLEKRLIQKIILYISYQWLKKEFYISKEVVRRFVYGFSVFYSELKPKSTPK